MEQHGSLPSRADEPIAQTRRTGSRAASSFFNEARAAAILKHGIIRQYIQPFASKVSSRYGGEVAYLDAYAGPGVYDDGRPGSPALAADTARRISTFRNLRCFYIEKDAHLFEDLRTTLAAVPHNGKVYQGEVEDHLDSVLTECRDLPLLAFLDPFGLAMPFGLLKEKLLWRIRGRVPPTEILMNFSLPGLRRNAGKLLTESTNPKYLKARQTILVQVDSTLGGDWWREIWAGGAPNRIGAILSEYVRRLQAAAGGCARGVIPVSKFRGSPIYYLIFLTQHPEGLWQFAEAVSLGRKEWADFCRRKELGLVDQMQFDFDENEATWISAIGRNIEKILSAGRPFRVIDRMLDVYGDTIGWARGTHVRFAIKRLHDEGKTPSTGKGPRVDRLLVEPPQ